MNTIEALTKCQQVDWCAETTVTRQSDKLLTSRHVTTRRYDNRTEALTKCQVDWYAENDDTTLTYEQLTAKQDALPCRLWAVNDTDFRFGHSMFRGHQN